MGRDANGTVNHVDLWQVIANLGSPCEACPEDVNGDGIVNTSHVVAVITHLGPCR